jgi:prephenate dehydratase
MVSAMSTGLMISTSPLLIQTDLIEKNLASAMPAFTMRHRGSTAQAARGVSLAPGAAAVLNANVCRESYQIEILSVR